VVYVFVDLEAELDREAEEGGEEVVVPCAGSAVSFSAISRRGSNGHRSSRLPFERLRTLASSVLHIAC
jgi:hypothetical protein